MFSVKEIRHDILMKIQDPHHPNAPEFLWETGWGKLPPGREFPPNGRTHGIACTRDGRIVVFRAGSPSVIILDPDGEVLSAWGDHAGAHGLSVVTEPSGDETLLLTDEVSGVVEKREIAGRFIFRLERPRHPLYETTPFKPTWADQNPATGEVWVADGYGANLVHIHDAEGRLLETLDGTEGPGRFDQPHGLAFRKSNSPPELYLTDRANHRVIVYDASGALLRIHDHLPFPCAFDFHDDLVLIPDLFCGIRLAKAESLDTVAEYGAHPWIGMSRDDSGWWQRRMPDRWPNLAGTQFDQPGSFLSAHDACFGPDGNLFVAEWVLGGRISRLTAVSA